MAQCIYWCNGCIVLDGTMYPMVYIALDQPSQGVTSKRGQHIFLKKEYIYHYFGHLIVHIHEKNKQYEGRLSHSPHSLVRIFALPYEYLLIQYL